MWLGEWPVHIVFFVSCVLANLLLFSRQMEKSDDKT